MSVWHWEETNYTKWATDKLKNLLDHFRWKNDDFMVNFTESIVTGEAMILMRRGRPVPSLHFEATICWEAEQFDTAETASGTYSLHDIDLESIEAPIATAVVVNKDNVLHQNVKKALSTSITDALTSGIRETLLLPLLKEETKTVELAQKLRNTNAPSPPSRVAPQPPATADADKSSFWKEQSLTSRALTQLREMLGEMGKHKDVTCMGGLCCLEAFDLRVTGEADRSLKKGNQMTIYEFDVGGSWTATSRDKKGVFLADAKGIFSIESFNSESIEELSVRFLCDDKTHPARQRVFDAVQSECAPKLVAMIRSFATELSN